MKFDKMNQIKFEMNLLLSFEVDGFFLILHGTKHHEVQECCTYKGNLGVFLYTSA